MAKGAAAGLALPRAPLCLVVEEPWAGLLDAAAQGRGFPVHRVQPARVERLARGAVGFAGVVDDRAPVAGDTANR
jgi:hypothetical protein